MKRPIFFTSFFSINCSGSKLRTSAAIWQAYCDTSKEVILPTPLLPASRLLQTSSVVLPTPQMSPMPVTTTRRAKLLLLFRVRADVVHGILDGADLLRIFVGNLDVEAFFERHHQLDRVQ